MTLIGGLGLLLAALPYALYPLDDSTTDSTIIPDLCIPGNLLQVCIRQNNVNYQFPKFLLKDNNRDNNRNYSGKQRHVLFTNPWEFRLMQSWNVMKFDCNKH